MPVMNPLPVRRIWLSVVAMLLLGVAAGVVWAWQADPAEWLVRRDGSIVLTEMAARDKFGVIVLFVIIGAIVSLVWAFAVTLALGDSDWRITPFVLAMTGLASVIACQIGIALGPAGPQAAKAPKAGALLASKLEVDSLAAFIVWPFFGLVGMVIALVVLLVRRRELEREASEKVAS